MNSRQERLIFTRALISLMRMCIVFILITLLALITGLYRINIQPNHSFLQSINFEFLRQMYPILLLGFVSLSFPAVFIFMYAFLKKLLFSLIRHQH